MKHFSFVGAGAGYNRRTVAIFHAESSKIWQFNKDRLYPHMTIYLYRAQSFECHSCDFLFTHISISLPTRPLLALLTMTFARILMLEKGKNLRKYRKYNNNPATPIVGGKQPGYFFAKILICWSCKYLSRCISVEGVLLTHLPSWINWHFQQLLLFLACVTQQAVFFVPICMRNQVEVRIKNWFSTLNIFWDMCLHYLSVIKIIKRTSSSRRYIRQCCVSY